MFKLNIFGYKKPSGQVVLEKIEPEIVLASEQLFDSAVKAAATNDLQKTIKYELDCIIWGKDVIDQTRSAREALYKEIDSYSILKDKFPKALHSMCYFSTPNNNEPLAKALAKDWVEKNYK